MFADENGLTCFIDRNSITEFVDQNGILLTCGSNVGLPPLPADPIFEIAYREG